MIGSKQFKLLNSVALEKGWIKMPKVSKAETLEQHKKAQREKDLKKKQKKQVGLPSSYSKHKK